MILKVSAVITALTTIFSFFVMLYKLIRNIEKKQETFIKQVNDNTKEILRMIIISNEVPNSVKVKACQRYKDLGGNGVAAIKCKYISEKYLEEFKKGGRA